MAVGGSNEEMEGVQQQGQGQQGQQQQLRKTSTATAGGDEGGEDQPTEKTVFESPDVGEEGVEPIEVDSSEEYQRPILIPQDEDTNQHIFELPDFSELVETPTQKLHRLQSEVAELKLELEKTSSETTSEGQESQSLLESLQRAQLTLTQLDERVKVKVNKNSSATAAHSFTKLQKAKTMLENNQTQVTHASPPELYYKKEITHLFELETRIKNLEHLLGPETQKPADAPEFHNFGGNLLRAYELLSLFSDPTHLDYAIQRLQLVNAELENLSVYQESLVSEGQHLYFEDEVTVNNQVDQLLDLFDRIEALVQQAPLLTSRLKTMGSFHNEALDMTLILPKLESLIETTHRDVQLAIDRTDQVTTQLHTNLTQINDSHTTLESQLQDLTKRVTTLQGQ